MGKGRSDKPAFERYKEELTKKTYRYTPEGAYKGAQFQNWLFGALSPLFRGFLFLMLILGVLVFLALFLYRYFIHQDEESLTNFLGLLTASIIIWFAVKDSKKKRGECSSNK